MGGGDFEASIEFVFANGLKCSVFRLVGLRTKFGIIGNGLSMMRSRSLIDDVRLMLGENWCTYDGDDITIGGDVDSLRVSCDFCRLSIVIGSVLMGLH